MADSFETMGFAELQDDLMDMAVRLSGELGGNYAKTVESIHARRKTHAPVEDEGAVALAVTVVGELLDIQLMRAHAPKFDQPTIVHARLTSAAIGLYRVGHKTT